MKKRNAICSLILAGVSLSTLLLQGCGSSKTSDGKIEVELLQYKPEAVAAFEAMEERFNATHEHSPDHRIPKRSRYGFENQTDSGRLSGHHRHWR